MQQEWVEVRGPSVEEAVQAGLDELGIGSADQAEIEVIQEPKRRFFVRVQDAVVRIKAKPAEKKRRRRRRKGGGDSGKSGEGRKEGQRGQRQQKSGGERGGRGKSGGGGGRSGQSRQRQGGDGQRNKPKSRAQDGGGANQRKRERNQGGSVATDDAQQEAGQPAKPDPAEQADVVVGFLRGLLEAFGLEGSVSSRIEDNIIFVDVTGEQTEALVGTKGAIMQAILELSRTVVQRKTFGSARIRLDIAGYAARRHKALEIYAARLAEQVKQDGEEVMLEPMNPADRKVVHDAIAGIEGVRTYSEGEEPNRSVIISLAPGFEAAAGEAVAQDDEDAVPDDTGGEDSPEGDAESE